MICSVPRDVTLKTRLLAERDGVFQWMLAGLVELLNLRFIPLGGTNSKRVHDRFRVSNDPVGAFVQAHCHLDPEVRVSKRVLLEAYEEFREEHDLSQAIGEWFFRSIYDRWPQLKETRPREAADGKRERMVGDIQLKGQSYAN